MNSKTALLAQPCSSCSGSKKPTCLGYVPNEYGRASTSCEAAPDLEAVLETWRIQRAAAGGNSGHPSGERRPFDSSHRSVPPSMEDERQSHVRTAQVNETEKCLMKEGEKHCEPWLPIFQNM